MTLRLAGVECGGTSFKLSLALSTPTNILCEQVFIPTTTPEETLQCVAEHLHTWDVDVIGLASFGPIDLNTKSPTYGHITSTPKPLWANCDLLGLIRAKLLQLAANDAQKAKYTTIPIGFQTDVNAAAAAEIVYGGHSDVDSLCYITIGTGIGVGIAMNLNQYTPTPSDTPHIVMLTNALHPEAGHIVVKKHSQETIAGLCPYHTDCLEGLANNHSTAARAGVTESSLPTLPGDHVTWECCAYYIAQLCTTLIYTVSPQRIIIGGGLAKRSSVIDKIRELVPTLLNGYIQTKELHDITKFIQTSIFDQPDSKASPGTIGALHMAYQAGQKK